MFAKFTLPLSSVVLIAAALVLCDVSRTVAQGPRYRADLELIDKGPDPDDVLPPGPSIFTCMGVIIDSGAPVTSFDQACARGFGLLRDQPGGQEEFDKELIDTVRPFLIVRGVGGGAVIQLCSRPLSINAGGLGGAVVRFKTVQDIKVYFPLPRAGGGTNLLGTDFISNLAEGQALTLRRDGSASFFDPKTAKGPRVPFEERDEQSDEGCLVEPLGTDTRTRLIVSEVSLGGPAGIVFADLAVVSGSPFSIVAQDVADRLGLVPDEVLVLDQELRDVLVSDGFLGQDTSALDLATLDSLELASDQGGLVHHDVTVLINPDSTESLLGSEHFFFDEGTLNAIEFDFANHELVFTTIFTGACCLEDGSCVSNATEQDCEEGLKGGYQGDETLCDDVDCQQLTCEGDANGDGTVDPLDSGFVLARFGCPVGTGDPDCDAADQNGDGDVDPLDSGFVLARFGECP